MTKFRKDNGNEVEVTDLCMDFETKLIQVGFNDGDGIKKLSLSIPLAKTIGLINFNSLKKLIK